MKPYPAYKASGIVWVDQIPSHWVERPLVSGLDRIYTGGTPESGNERYWSDEMEGIPFVAIGDMSAVSHVRRTARFVSHGGRASKGLAVVPVGSVLYSMYASVGKAALLEIPAVINQAILGLVGADYALHQQFLWRWLSVWERHIHTQTNASTQANINLQIVRKLQTLFPPLDEQRAIADFLDGMDARITRFIAARRKMIALMEEKKQVVINQAVTHGLDPSVPMKDSGVDWLGEIPAHWDVKRGAALFTERNETGYPALPILEVSLKTGVTVRDLSDPKRKQMMSDRSGYKRALSGDLPYNMMRMWQGAVGVAPVEGLVSPAYVVLAPRATSNSDYYAAIFRIPSFMTEVSRNSRGIVSDRDRLYWDSFKQLQMPHPPLPEQEEIVAHIDYESSRVDALITRHRREIELIQEYRTRLISDVITGKLDVRGVELPEVEEVIGEEIEAAMEEEVTDEMTGVLEEIEA